MCLWNFFLFFLKKNEDNALNRYDSRDITNLSRKQHWMERWMQNKIVWSKIVQNKRNKKPTIHNFRSDHSIICWILKNEDKWKKEMKYHTNTRIHGPGTGIFDIFKKLWFWIEIIISKLAKTRYHFHKFDLNLTFEVHAPTTTASRRRSSSKAPFCYIYMLNKNFKKVFTS